MVHRFKKLKIYWPSFDLVFSSSQNWPTADTANCPLHHRLEKSSSRPNAAPKKVKTGAQRRVKKAPPLFILSPSALAPFWLFWGCQSGATAEGKKTQNLSPIFVKAGTRTRANVWSGWPASVPVLEPCHFLLSKMLVSLHRTAWIMCVSLCQNKENYNLFLICTQPLYMASLCPCSGALSFST
jgi:hypothetical protein